MLNIPLDKLAFIIAKARQFAAKVNPVLPEDASNGTDDGDVEVLEDIPERDAIETELADAIEGLSAEERDELVALMWLGRGDLTKDEWGEAVRQAREERTHPTAEYLMGTPLLADYLEEALDELGYPLADLASGRL
jgi:hypothetical protein